MRFVSVVAMAVTLVMVAGCGAGPPPEDEGPTASAAVALENGSFHAVLAGHDIHYEVHGSGPVVMTVPNSWGLSLEGLRGMYRPLEADVTMVYFDPRGMGSSGPVEAPADMSMEAVREDFEALRQHLGLQRVHAIGWSNGAMNLIQLAAEAPDTLRSATFVHGAASFTQEDMVAFGERFPALMRDWQSFEAEIAASDWSEDEKTARTKAFWLERYFPESLAQPELTLAKLRSVFDPAAFSRAHADYTETTYPTFDARELLATITVPSLVIAGAADMMPPDKVRELADGLADAEFVVLDQSGHFGPIEEPDRFRTLVLRFWGVGPSSPAAG